MKHQWEEQESGEIDIFAFSNESCNGPRCVRCGRGFCHHCNPRIYNEECDAND